MPTPFPWLFLIFRTVVVLFFCFGFHIERWKRILYFSHKFRTQRSFSRVNTWLHSLLSEMLAFRRLAADFFNLEWYGSDILDFRFLLSERAEKRRFSFSVSLVFLSHSVDHLTRGRYMQSDRILNILLSIPSITKSGALCGYYVSVFLTKMVWWSHRDEPPPPPPRLILRYLGISLTP